MGAIEIAAALAASRRAVRLYPPEHPTHREALRDLVAAVTASIDVRPLVLNVREGRLYEGSEVITETSPATRSLAQALEARRVESLTFHVGFGEVDGEGLSDVLGLRPSPELQVQEELEAREVRAVTVSELEDNSSRAAEERDRRRESDRALYRASLSALNNIVAGLDADTTVEPFEAQRVLAALIDRVAEEPEAFLALATMTGHGERWRFQAVGVALYALVLGRYLGRSDKELLGLGLAGLLHDVGAVLASANPATAENDHPGAGARALGALPDEDATAITVAFEHHMGVDGSGAPERDAGYEIHPYSRLIAIADRYDALIRPAEGLGLPPDRAAARLLEEASGGALDPVLTRLFVQAIGELPVGSVVMLSDRSIGLVRAPGDDHLRPQLRLVLASDGTELRPTLDIDLSEDERDLVEVLPGALLGLQVSDYL